MLYSFSGAGDGGNPVDLAMGPGGVLHGTAWLPDLGMVFSFKP